MNRRATYAIGSATVAVLATAAAGSAALRSAGARIRASSDPELDSWATVPDGVRHHEIPVHDGAVIHVAELGEGPPILLLHGVGLRWSVWASQMRLLSPRHRVLAWDMRGHGGSTVGRNGVDLAAIAGDIVSVLEAMDLRDAVIVGHSMGGMALARCCTDDLTSLSERSRGLMFLATSAAMVDKESLGGAVVALADRFARLNPEGSRFHYAWGDTDVSAVIIRSVFGSRVSASMVDDMRRMFAEMDPAVTVACGRSIASHDERLGLERVDLPCSVVVGSADRLTSTTHARVLRAALSGAEMHVVEGVGHQVMQEAPHELSELIERLAAR